MDPNATLEAVEDALSNCDYEAAEDAAIALHGWLKKGGFEPMWQACPRAAEFYGDMYPSWEGV